MRFKALILPFLCAGITVAAETKHDHEHGDAKSGAESSEGLDPREAAVDRLLSERTSTETFEAAVTDARKAGVNDQVILEARFIFNVDRHDDAAIAALLPQFEKQNETFKVQDSEIFATKEDWLAVIEYVKALVSLQGGDKAGFKQHITEAFWLSPKQGTAFAAHIDRLRMSETMASVKIDFATAFAPLDGKDSIPLSKIMGENKALLLQFWSPWNSECEAFLPDFITISKELEKNQIGTGTLVMEGSAKAISDTREILKPHDKKPGTWLIDDEKAPLSLVLRVQNVPIFVLVSREGSVLYNGTADAPELWDALKKINPSITRPKLQSEQEGE